jgi:hypothetical protein
MVGAGREDCMMWALTVPWHSVSCLIFTTYLETFNEAVGLPRIQSLIQCRRSNLLRPQPQESQKMKILSIKTELSCKDGKGGQSSD